MYVPRIHKVTDDQKVFDYIREHGFATLVSWQDQRIVATHIPLYLDLAQGQPNRLLGHVARGNEQIDALKSEKEMLAIFMNTHAYISSSWYDHINVPTWNYVAVHAYCTPRILEGEELTSSLKKLVEQYEEGRKDRFHISDMPEKMKEAHIKGLVGFELRITRIEAAHKLSQNRNSHDYQNIIQQLEDHGEDQDRAVAQEMKKLRS